MIPGFCDYGNYMLDAGIYCNMIMHEAEIHRDAYAIT